MAEKPIKPYKTFPLTPHSTGWVKKINGEVKWIAGHVPAEDAERIWHEKAPVLLGHVAPVTAGKGALVRELFKRFLNMKEADTQAKGKGWHYYCQYRDFMRKFVRDVGQGMTIDQLTPDHFSTFGMKMKAVSPRTARQAARHIMAVFNYADGEDWIDRPVKFGKAFRKLARIKSSSPGRMLPKVEALHLLLQESAAKVERLKDMPERSADASIQFNAMLWLALNCGYGPTDLAELPRALVDLDEAVIDYRRAKTEVKRRAFLWPETIAALRPAMALRPDDTLLFRTREGNAWVTEVPKMEEGIVVGVNIVDNVNQTYRKFALRVEKKHKVKIKRPGEGFYTLRHVHRTASDEAGDSNASRFIMGHALPGMDNVYVQVSDARLQRVAEFIREKLRISQVGPALAGGRKGRAMEAPAASPALRKPRRRSNARAALSR